MARIDIGPSAKRDLARIVTDMRGQGRDQAADKLEAELGVLLRRLAVFPESGSPRPGLGLEIRSAAVKPYVVLHRYDRAADTVFILRVLHGRRQITLDAP
jgi:toxin ParE1/3/4